MSKIYSGYDLGDGETIVEIAKFESNDLTSKPNYENVTMPGVRTPGVAIPSCFAYDINSGKVVLDDVISSDPESVRDIHTNFKRTPSSMVGEISAKRAIDLTEAFRRSSSWPDKSYMEAYTPQLLEYRNMVASYTNRIFTDKNFASRIGSFAEGSEEIVITVGHPTNWNDLDCVIYEKILRATVLGQKEYCGKKLSLLTDRESRAAFLYVRTVQKQSTAAGKYVLLIDMGSSTIDVTALTNNSNDSKYNSGSNYLGARGIDLLIQKWYLEQLSNSAKEDYRQLVKQNPGMDNTLLLSCRKAKETIYVAENGKAKILLDGFNPNSVSLTREIVDNLVATEPIAPLLLKIGAINNTLANELGNKTWLQLFQEFLNVQKSFFQKNNMPIGRIIMTGSASRMTFIENVMKSTFPGVLYGQDMDPSRTISKGLVLVGFSNEKSLAFQGDMNRLLNQKLPEIIKKDMSALADAMSEVIANEVVSIAKQELAKWKEGKYSTLKEAMNAVERECSESRLTTRLQNCTAYNKATENWLREQVGKDIALEIKDLCKKYGVDDQFSLSDLNIMNVPKVSVDVDGGKILGGNIMDAIVTIVAVVAGIVAAVALPTVLGIIIGLIWLISSTLASIIFTILSLLPGVGWAILLGLAGVGAAYVISNGWDELKGTLINKLQTANLPQWVRNRVNLSDIQNKMNIASIKCELKEGIVKEENIIVPQIQAALHKQVEIKMDDIKYAIESK